MTEKENKVALHKCHSYRERSNTHPHTHPWVATGIITHLFRGRATPTATAVRTERNYQKHVYVQLGRHTWVLSTPFIMQTEIHESSSV